MMKNTMNTFKPIFIVGNSRSGTTLMSRILGNHPLIFTFEELHFFEELWNPTVKLEPLSSKQAIILTTRLINIQRHGYLNQKACQDSDFLQEAQKIIEELPNLPTPISIFQAFLTYESSLHKKTIPCEHTPQNTLYLHEILESYPKARIIHLIRDPRDVLLSQKNRWRRPFISKNIPKKEAIRYWINYHPITISRLWNVNVRNVNQFKNDSRVLTILFEELVSEPEKTVKKICQFLEIHFDSSLFIIPQVGSSCNPDQPEQKGMNATRAYAWREGGLNSREIFFCQQINQDIMQEYGYSLEKVKVNPILIALSLVTFPCKLFLALIFNLKRTKNIVNAIKKRLR